MRAKRFMLSLIATVFFLALATQAQAVTTVYTKKALTGGGATALDGIDGAGLVDGDLAFVTLSGSIYFYILDADSAASESSPTVISPDANAGDKRWILQTVYGASALSGGAQYFLPVWTAADTLGKLASAGTSGWPLVSGGAAANPAFSETLSISSIDLSSGIFKVPNGTGPTIDAAGKIGIDTTKDQLLAYGSALTVHDPRRTFSIVVPAVADTDDMLFVKLPFGITATSLDCIVSAATSATINIQECDSAGANCTDMATSDLACDTDGANTTTFNNAAADAGDWLKLDVASISGTPGTLTVTLTYTITRE